jgi:hypothetical protein
MNALNSLHSTFAEELYSLPPKVLVIIPKPWNQVNDEERELLSRILSAVKLSLAAVQILVFQKFVTADVSVFAPRYIIAFGVSIAATHEMYEVYESDGITTLQSENLDQLDDPRKKKLWKALRQIFSN